MHNVLCAYVFPKVNMQQDVGCEMDLVFQKLEVIWGCLIDEVDNVALFVITQQES